LLNDMLTFLLSMSRSQLCQTGKGKDIKGYQMKKSLAVLCALTLVLAVTMLARAAQVTITFDEQYVTSGPTNDRYDGTQVDTQYSVLGVTWVDTVDDDPNVLTGQGVTHPGEFSGSWSDTDNMLWNYGAGGGGTTPVNAPILLSVPANSFSFQFRRPQAPGAIDVRLYMGEKLVHETIGFSWDPAVDGDWKTFFYCGDPFNKVVLSSGDKFNTDNYSFDLVPVIDKVGGVKEPGEKIRIIGSGFGEPQGESEVHIGPKVYGPGHTKIKLWTDTMIKVKLPNYKCNWFKGNDYRRRKIWVMVGGEDGVSSNIKGIKVFKPDTCP
jgi:hypothetical protein